MPGRPRQEFQGKVLIADDHAIFRVGLRQTLRRCLKVRKFIEVERFSEVIDQLKDKDVALAIVDLRMPGLSGPKDVARIRRLRPDVRLVVLSASDDREDILEALAAGTHGYIVKSEPTEQLIRRIRHILSGEIYVPPSLAELPPSPPPAAEPAHDAAPDRKPLSGRQRQVLRGVVEGKSNKEIAQALNVAEGTVKMHLAALFRVLGAANRAHAAALGKQLIS